MLGSAAVMAFGAAVWRPRSKGGRRERRRRSFGCLCGLSYSAVGCRLVATAAKDRTSPPALPVEGKPSVARLICRLAACLRKRRCRLARRAPPCLPPFPQRRQSPALRMARRLHVCANARRYTLASPPAAAPCSLAFPRLLPRRPSPPVRAACSLRSHLRAPLASSRAPIYRRLIRCANTIGDTPNPVKV